MRGSVGSHEPAQASGSGGEAAGGGGEGRDGNGREKKPAATVGRVALHRLFTFADRMDAALMAVGAAAALANGMAQPLMTFIFGDVIDAFGSTASADVLHSVVKVRAPSPPLLVRVPTCARHAERPVQVWLIIPFQLNCFLHSA